MNLLPKINLWVIKCVQIGRLISTTRPNWFTRYGGSPEYGGSVTYRPPVDSEKKPVDFKDNAIETMGYVPPHVLPTSEGNPGTPSTTARTFTTPDEAGKEAGEFLTRFYGDQVKYFRKIAKVNKNAMKRVKKLRRDWLKFCEKHF